MHKLHKLTVLSICLVTENERVALLETIYNSCMVRFQHEYLSPA